MRPSPAWFVPLLMALPSIVFASGTSVPRNSAPPVVSYLCSDGRTASVVYRGGSDFQHARALISHDGRSFELGAAPTLYGVRYRGEASDGPVLAWSLRGERAVLSEAPEADSYTRPERELLRCIRVRGAIAAETHDSAEAH